MITPSTEELKTAAEQQYTDEKLEDSNDMRRTLTELEREQNQRDNDVQELARQYTTESLYNQNPFEADENSPLNPLSVKFNARAFAKSMLSLAARDPEKWKQRTAGFSFKDLDVFGFGSATDYQKTVVCILNFT
jgi:ATP-binding cassette subfamily G (WHITE) protein 2 (PDR)